MLFSRRGLKNRLVGPRTDVRAVDRQCFYIGGWAHDATSSTASISQTPAGHRVDSMCSKYSSLKYRRVLNTGLGAVCPSPHRLVNLTMSHKSTSSSKSRWVAGSLADPHQQLIHLRGAGAARDALAA